MMARNGKTKIRFTEDREVLDHNRKPVASYKVGQVVEMTGASARHFLNRGCAVEVQGGGRKAEAAPPPAEDPKPDDPPAEDPKPDDPPAAAGGKAAKGK